MAPDPFEPGRGHPSAPFRIAEQRRHGFGQSVHQFFARRHRQADSALIRGDLAGAPIIHDDGRKSARHRLDYDTPTEFSQAGEGKHLGATEVFLELRVLDPSRERDDRREAKLRRLGFQGGPGRTVAND